MALEPGCTAKSDGSFAVVARETGRSEVPGGRETYTTATGTLESTRSSRLTEPLVMADAGIFGFMPRQRRLRVVPRIASHCAHRHAQQYGSYTASRRHHTLCELRYSVIENKVDLALALVVDQVKRRYRALQRSQGVEQDVFIPKPQRLDPRVLLHGGQE